MFITAKKQRVSNYTLIYSVRRQHFCYSNHVTQLTERKISNSKNISKKLVIVKLVVVRKISSIRYLNERLMGLQHFGDGEMGAGDLRHGLRELLDSVSVVEFRTGVHHILQKKDYCQ